MIGCFYDSYNLTEFICKILTNDLNEFYLLLKLQTAYATSSTTRGFLLFDHFLCWLAFSFVAVFFHGSVGVFSQQPASDLLPLADFLLVRFFRQQRNLLSVGLFAVLFLSHLELLTFDEKAVVVSNDLFKESFCRVDSFFWFDFS